MFADVVRARRGRGTNTGLGKHRRVRRRTVFGKRRIVAQGFASDVKVAVAARGSGLNASLLFNWKKFRRKDGETHPGSFVPVVVTLHKEILMEDIEEDNCDIYALIGEMDTLSVCSTSRKTMAPPSELMRSRSKQVAS